MFVAEQLCKEYNTAAMKFIDKRAFDQAMELLQKAQVRLAGI